MAQKVSGLENIKKKRGQKHRDWKQDRPQESSPKISIEHFQEFRPGHTSRRVFWRLDPNTHNTIHFSSFVCLEEWGILGTRPQYYPLRIEGRGILETRTQDKQCNLGCCGDSNPRHRIHSISCVWRSSIWRLGGAKIWGKGTPWHDEEADPSKTACRSLLRAHGGAAQNDQWFLDFLITIQLAVD